MNLDMVPFKNKTEDLLFSITKNCKTLIHQAHKRPQETFDFQLTKPGEKFSFKPPINHGLNSKWMVGLPGLKYIILFLI